MAVLVPTFVTVCYTWAQKEMGRAPDPAIAAEPAAAAAHDRAR
ncbi:hypothetical protein [Caldinitratiruptor microaerophilus]|uniref:Uncharacterized protein n=1 Tax=Caldinitratiruptor microaerophilus TaxID=671077 RepID=A0AA35CI90_9FIRM|nr:hypothetical protein [Caldinitratiruptor microaerophilus]BDG59579.1 hypothetical protein caldi_06690 [Caldinitratiruptor microaerophilus]